MVVCRRYEQVLKMPWDRFVDASKTPLFFFKRDYLEYHSDRFLDCSLLFYQDEQLLAIFPACQQGAVLNSHGGLTYGGLLLSNKTRADQTLTIVNCLLEYAKQAGFEKILYKAIPYFLSTQVAQEDLYALIKVADARLYRRDLSSIIALDKRIKISKGKSWLIARAKKLGLAMTSSNDWVSFHQLLSSVLLRHRAKPVHSVAELEKLALLFPHNIQLKCVELDGVLLAVALLFKFNNTVHTQYLATNEAGKELGALDYLIEQCIHESKEAGFEYFSFGISTEEQGSVLNTGLIAQKENFGARGATVDFYEISL